MTSSLVALTSVLALGTLNAAPAAAAPAPRNEPVAFTCTPLDFSGKLNFHHGYPIPTADLFAYVPGTEGFNGNLGLNTDGHLDAVAKDSTNIGQWGFDVCQPVDGVVAPASHLGIQSLQGHVTYTPHDTSIAKTCLTVSDPSATDFSHLDLVSGPCNDVSSALKDQRGSIFNLDLPASNENTLTLLGPGPEGLYNQTYIPGTDSLHFRTGKGLDLVQGVPNPKFYFKDANATY